MMQMVKCISCDGRGIKDWKDQYVCEVCIGVGMVTSESQLKCGKTDMVNYPSHYTFGTIEVIDVIDDWKLGFYEGQVIKYVARAKHKGDELENLKKAQWYLNRRIKQMEERKEK